MPPKKKLSPSKTIPASKVLPRVSRIQQTRAVVSLRELDHPVPAGTFLKTRRIRNRGTLASFAEQAYRPERVRETAKAVHQRMAPPRDNTTLLSHALNPTRRVRA